MKLVKEHINEKYTTDSDPIKDMGIGYPDWKDLKRGDIIKCIKFTQFSQVWAPQGIIKNTGETIYRKPKQSWMGNLFEVGEYYSLLDKVEEREDGKIVLYARNIKHRNGSERLVLTPKQLDKRFKVIKKGINEKFTDESDPIYDMGIGITMEKIKDYIKLVKNDSMLSNYEEDYLWLCAKHGNTNFVEYLLNTKKYNIHYREDYALRWACKYNHVKIVKLLLDAGADIHAQEDEGIEYARNHKDQILYKLIKHYIVKHHKVKNKKHIDEKFTEESDPIHDMGIGSIIVIKKWLAKMNIRYYTINDDLTIDIPNNVDLDEKLKKEGKLPEYIQFNIVNGAFFIRYNNLTTLKGCPKIIKENNSYYGSFRASNNNLSSLKYAPKRVEGLFDCAHNAVKFTNIDVRKVCKYIKQQIVL